MGSRRNATDVGASAFHESAKSVWSFDRPREGQHVAAYVLLLFRVYQDVETGIWEGMCDELHVGSCGESYQEALAATIEATQEYLNLLEEYDERERMFDELGLRVDTTEPAEPVNTALPLGAFVSAQRGVLIAAAA